MGSATSFQARNVDLHMFKLMIPFNPRRQIHRKVKEKMGLNLTQLLAIHSIYKDLLKRKVLITKAFLLPMQILKFSYYCSFSAMTLELPGNTEHLKLKAVMK